MSMGYDAAELLAEIKAKTEEIARLAPSNFTEPEAKLAVGAIREMYTPERMTHEMQPEAASAIRKLTAVLDKFEAARAADIALIASLTEEERQAIRDMRANKKASK